MVIDEGVDHLARLGALEIEREHRVDGLALIGADVALFAGDEFGVDQQPMLEIIDRKLGGFAESDRAEMPSELEAALVCGFDGFGERVVRDVHVRLEGGDAFLRPVLDQAAGLRR
jgi:hypothetical protein